MCLAVVTNSARATAERQLQHAGLLDAFERVIGTDEVGVFKPSRLVYAHALAQLGVLARRRGSSRPTIGTSSAPTQPGCTRSSSIAVARGP